MIVALRCAVCGEEVDAATPFAWRCPNATAADRHHVLHLVDDGAPAELDDDPNPFVRHRRRLAWWAFARAHHLPDDVCVALTREIAAGFETTPFAWSGPLSAELGREIWIKDETGTVGGSHKARHLVTVLLHLRAVEVLGMLHERPPLAIASCGNAAIAAATLAARVGWALDVFVPQWASDAVLTTLSNLGARLTICERSDGDPPGDPTVHRFREAVGRGAVPFSVQGPENAYSLDGGRTLGWEMAEAASSAGVELGRVYVQVGGGALAACVGASLGGSTALHAVQAEGCAPLARAWDLLDGLPTADAASRWSDIMWPWDSPTSAADGILDDETYDWLAIVDAMRDRGGCPVVASEADIGRAHDLAGLTGINASATGTAGLAGLLADLDNVPADEPVAVVFSGSRR